MKLQKRATKLDETQSSVHKRFAFVLTNAEAGQVERDARAHRLGDLPQPAAENDPGVGNGDGRTALLLVDFGVGFFGAGAGRYVVLVVVVVVVVSRRQEDVHLPPAAEIETGFGAASEADGPRPDRRRRLRIVGFVGVGRRRRRPEPPTAPGPSAAPSPASAASAAPSASVVQFHAAQRGRPTAAALRRRRQPAAAFVASVGRHSTQPGARSVEQVRLFYIFFTSYSTRFNGRMSLSKTDDDKRSCLRFKACFKFLFTMFFWAT